MYLQEALKDGLARFVIQGLTRTSESYKEAVKCLREQYNGPFLAQKEHICSIGDALPVKNGSNKKIHRDSFLSNDSHMTSVLCIE